MPPKVASAAPIPHLAALLALLALAGGVKVLQLECLIAADFICFANRTGKAEHIALLLHGVGRLCILHRYAVCLLLNCFDPGVPSCSSPQVGDIDLIVRGICPLINLSTWTPDILWPN